MLALLAMLAAIPATAADVVLTGGAFGAGYGPPLHSLAALLGFVAIGLWSGLLGGGTVWQFPALAIAAALGASYAFESGFALPYAQQGLMAVPVVIGVMIVLGLRLPLLSPPVVVVLAGVFEGHALVAVAGSPHLVPWAGFGAAALLATAGGLGLAVIVSSAPLALGVRALGAGAVAAGVLMLLDKL